MRTNTQADYEKAIKDKYAKLKASGEADLLLLEPTPGGLKKLCQILQPNLNAVDLEVFKRFFILKDGIDINKQIEDFDTSRFKALCKFLNGNSEKSAIERLNLLAVLLDLPLRPFQKFRTSEISVTEVQQNEVLVKSEVISPISEEETIVEVTPTEDNNIEPGFALADNNIPQDTETTIIPQKFFITGVSEKRKQANRIALILLSVMFLAVILFSFKNVLFKEAGCMIWKNDHYEAVSCDLEVNSFAGNKVILLDRGLLNYQKKVNGNDITTFFNADGKARIFYGKSANKKYEYFTYPGEHPETGVQLKPITEYIINNHIKKQGQ